MERLTLLPVEREALLPRLVPETEDREVLPVERLMLLLEERATAVAPLWEALVLRLTLLAAEREALVLRLVPEAEEREILLREERDTSDGASRSEDRVDDERLMDCRPEREYGRWLTDAPPREAAERLEPMVRLRGP